MTICCRKDYGVNNTAQKSLSNNLFILINSVGVACSKKRLDIQAQLIEACTEVTE